MKTTLRQSTFTCRYLFLSLLFIIPLFSLLPALASEAATVKIGVLAKRGSENVVQNWTPTAEYLNRAIPAYSFEIVPLDFTQVRQAVKDQTIDFLITNSSYYVALEKELGVSRIATMKNLLNHLPKTLFGGVIFTRSDRADINGLHDIIGKSFGAVDRESLGGWLMALREFHTQGITSERDFKELSFVGTHDAVVLAVLKGEVDAGTVRTDTLEKMVEEGTINLASLKILNPQSPKDNFHYIHSTRLYPEWPFAKLKHTPDKLAEDVAIALLRMPPTSAAAQAPHIGGWTVPLDYQPVHELMQELEIGPYAHQFGKIRFIDFVRQYRAWLFIISILFILLLVVTIGTIRLNRKLVAAEEELSQYSLNLEEFVDERTVDLKKSTSSLAEAQRLAHLGNWEWLIPENQVWWSAEAYRIYGFDPEKSSPTYESFLAVVHPADRELVKRAIDDALEKRASYSVEHRLLLADGTERQVHEQGEVFWDGDGKPVRMVGIVQDISERIELENRLRQAQKMEAIGTLAGGIAHDFNNILAVIFGYTDMAREAAPSGTQLAKYLEQVSLAAHRAKELVKQILAFSRQSVTELIPLQIQPLIKEGLKMIRSSIPSTISITEDIDVKSGIILADPSQVHQILMNLCTNAYHAMEETGGVLSVTLKPALIGPDEQKMHVHATPGEYLELTVSDTGCGIGPDIIDKIFNPYFTTKGAGKGTGMGLAIIHGIVSDYGGMITVESQLGQGTTFHVFFPVVALKAVPEINEAEDIPRGNERILFVDDEELLAEMGKEMLERLGYRVTLFRSGVEALEVFKNTPDAFDLVITDQTMPGITGSELSRMMMQIRPDIPIILCTGYSNLIDEDSAKALGIKEFALKPLTTGTVATLIRKVLKGEPQTS